MSPDIDATTWWTQTIGNPALYHSANTPPTAPRNNFQQGLAVQAQGQNIRTVEGLAKNGTLHPLQRAFMAHHSLQCGFCTPGFLMLTANALEKNPRRGKSSFRLPS